MSLIKRVATLLVEVKIIGLILIFPSIINNDDCRYLRLNKDVGIYKVKFEYVYLETNIEYVIIRTKHSLALASVLYV